MKSSMIAVLAVLAAVGCSPEKPGAGPFVVPSEEVIRYVDEELQVVCYRFYFDQGISCVKLGAHVDRAR
jgi:hypothetical protein